MKPITVPAVLLTLFVLLSSCASSEQAATQSERTLSALTANQQQLDRVLQRLEGTRTAFRNIIQVESGEVKEAFNNYRKQVTRMVEAKEELADRVKHLQSQSRKYLSEWENESEQYESSRLRSNSQERRRELKQDFRAVLSASEEINRALEAYLSDLREVRSYLSNDLTVTGARAVSNNRELYESANRARGAINGMEGAIQNAKRELGG